MSRGMISVPENQGDLFLRRLENDEVSKLSVKYAIYDPFCNFMTLPCSHRYNNRG